MTTLAFCLGLCVFGSFRECDFSLIFSVFFFPFSISSLLREDMVVESLGTKKEVLKTNNESTWSSWGSVKMHRNRTC